jgi:hypothetical protein
MLNHPMTYLAARHSRLRRDAVRRWLTETRCRNRRPAPVSRLSDARNATTERASKDARCLCMCDDKQDGWRVNLDG